MALPGLQRTLHFVSTIGGNENQFKPANTLDNPFPTGFVQPTGTALGQNTFAGGSVIFSNPDRAIPHVRQYSLGVQHQLPWNVRLDASYSGSRTYDINTNANQAGGARNINVNTTEQLTRAQSDPNYLNASVPNPFKGLLPGTNLNGDTVPRSQLLKPFPQFNNVSLSGESVGRIWYDSLQVSVEKRYTQGLVVVGAYTFSKNLEQVAFANPQDSSPSKSLTSQDRPHRLVLSGAYELPFGRGKKFASSVGRLTNLAIAGWQYNAIATIQSGLPLDLPGNVYLVGDPTVSNQSNNFYFNTCVQNVAGTSATQPNETHSAFNTPCTNPAFRLRGPFTLRTTEFRTGLIRQPFRPQWDMSINKKFYVTETVNAQFRFEMFNAFNTPIRSGPNNDPTSPNFGLIPNNQNNIPRQIQLGFKLNF